MGKSGQKNIGGNLGGKIWSGKYYFLKISKIIEYRVFGQKFIEPDPDFIFVEFLVRISSSPSSPLQIFFFSSSHRSETRRVRRVRRVAVFLVESTVESIWSSQWDRGCTLWRAATTFKKRRLLILYKKLFLGTSKSRITVGKIPKFTVREYKYSRITVQEMAKSRSRPSVKFSENPP